MILNICVSYNSLQKSPKILEKSLKSLYIIFHNFLEIFGVNCNKYKYLISILVTDINQ